MADYTVSVNLGGIPISAGLILVTAYGATGDGVTDDTSAIQDAIDAAEANGGDAVHFPDGDYVTSSTLEIDSDNVTLVGTGGGSRIISSTVADVITLEISAAGVTVKDMTFVGGCTTQAGGANECIKLLSGALDTEITGCRFTGVSASAGYNVQIRGESGVTNPRITNNYFDRVIGTASSYGYGIQLASVAGGVISDNVSIQSGTQGRHHIYLSVDCSDFVVSNNRLYGGTSAMITCYSNTTAGERLLVTGNVLDGAGTGGGTSGGIEMVDAINNSVMSNNIVHDVSGPGIKLEGNGDAPSECVDNHIIGNIITAPGEAGIELLGSERAFVFGNSIKGVDGYAAIAMATAGSGTAHCDDTAIIGNYVTGTSHTYAVDAGSADISIIGNHFMEGSSGTFNNISPETRKAIANYATDWPVDFSGSGDPEGEYTAVVGATYRRTNSGAARTLWVKESGTGDTGWAALGDNYVKTAAADDTTPTVQDVDILVLDDNTVATAITQLDDGRVGQKITLVVTATSNEPTIADSGNFNLSAAWAPDAGDTLSLITADGTAWYETARSTN